MNVAVFAQAEPLKLLLAIRMHPVIMILLPLCSVCTRYRTTHSFWDNFQSKMKSCKPCVVHSTSPFACCHFVDMTFKADKSLQPWRYCAHRPNWVEYICLSTRAQLWITQHVMLLCLGSIKGIAWVLVSDSYSGFHMNIKKGHSIGIHGIIPTFPHNHLW